MLRYAVIVACIIGIGAPLGAIKAAGVVDVPGAAHCVSVSSDSGKHLYSSVGQGVGSHMRHMMARDYTHRVSAQSQADTGPGPAGERLTPAATELRYANPVGASAVFDLSLEDRGPVRLEVYSVEGRKVATLLDKPMAPGFYSVQWNCKDTGGYPVTPGVYFCCFETTGLSRTTKMVITE